jgi:hypothetical protein
LLGRMSGKYLSLVSVMLKNEASALALSKKQIPRASE